MAIGAAQMTTVTDFVSGTDHLSMSKTIAGPLVKLNDPGAANATLALDNAQAALGGGSPAEYLFVYGGSGAGYLFYNGDSGGATITSGMTLVGDNAETSVKSTDITASPFI
jgi:hypothetical protein